MPGMDLLKGAISWKYLQESKIGLSGTIFNAGKNCVTEMKISLGWTPENTRVSKDIKWNTWFWLAKDVSGVSNISNIANVAIVSCVSKVSNIVDVANVSCVSKFPMFPVFPMLPMFLCFLQLECNVIVMGWGCHRCVQCCQCFQWHQVKYNCDSLSQVFPMLPRMQDRPQGKL